MPRQLLRSDEAGPGAGGLLKEYRPNSAKIPVSAQVTPGTMFYSDGPENIVPRQMEIACLLDPDAAGFRNPPTYFLKETLSGTFRLYTFHTNNLPTRVTAGIILHNTSESPVTVSLHQHAVESESHAPSPMGVVQWYHFAHSREVRFALRPAEVRLVRELSIVGLGAGHHYTMLADVDVSGGSVDVYDAAFVRHADQVLSAQQAPPRGRRGLANGYRTAVSGAITVATPEVPVDAGLITRYSCMASISDTRGADVPSIVDPDGATTYRLEGCFGCTHEVALTVTNGDGQRAHRIVISGGAETTAPARFVYSYQEVGGASRTNVSRTNWLNLIDDSLAPGQTQEYRFQHMMAGGFNAPLAVGVTVVE